MRTFAITGGHGFLGWHLRCLLKAVVPDAEVRMVGQEDLVDPTALANIAEGCDTLFHLAGVNSHDADAAKANVELAEAVADGLDRVSMPLRIVYSNSAHAKRGTAYGQSKGAAARVLRHFAERSRFTFADVILPNLFGERGRPYYNSVVATFCDQIVRGVSGTVNRDAPIELLHARCAAAELLRYADHGPSIEVRVTGDEVAVGDTYDRLGRYFDTYSGTHEVPRLATKFDVRLFNQLRMVMYPGAYPISLARHSDSRGEFFEIVRSSGDGQTSFSTTRPGFARGDHWHADKIERFIVVRGSATIKIRRLFDETVETFHLDGAGPSFVDMPTLHAHNITNTGDDELLTVFWANDHFCKDAPDTWLEPVALAANSG